MLFVLFSHRVAAAGLSGTRPEAVPGRSSWAWPGWSRIGPRTMLDGGTLAMIALEPAGSLIYKGTAAGTFGGQDDRMRST